MHLKITNLLSLRQYFSVYFYTFFIDPRSAAISTLELITVALYIYMYFYPSIISNTFYILLTKRVLLEMNKVTPIDLEQSAFTMLN